MSRTPCRQIEIHNFSKFQAPKLEISCYKFTLTIKAQVNIFSLDSWSDDSVQICKIQKVKGIVRSIQLKVSTFKQQSYSITTKICNNFFRLELDHFKSYKVECKHVGEQKTPSSTPFELSCYLCFVIFLICLGLKERALSFQVVLRS